MATGVAATHAWQVQQTRSMLLDFGEPDLRVPHIVHVSKTW